MKERKKLKPGERVFSIALLLFSLWLLHQSLQMWHKAPGITSYGAMPLAISVVMILCMLYVIFVEDIKAVTDNPGKGIMGKIKYALRYVLPLDVAVFIALIVIYTVMLLLGASFLISSLFFMLATITYLMPKDKKTIRDNILFTIVILGLIYVVFQIGFKITLP